MASDKTKRLEETTRAIQERWGITALRKLDTASSQAVACMSTQFPSLDRALGIGGIPRGRITEIAGRPTSGMGTLALRIIASTQAGGDMGVYIDSARTFDPEYATLCGVALDRLLVCRPKDHELGLSVAHDLIASGGVGVLVFDLGAESLKAGGANGIGKLLPVLAQSPCALVFLAWSEWSGQENHEPPGGVSYHATLRLKIEKERWLHRRADVRGYRARVTVLKNKLASPGCPVGITISLQRGSP